MEHEGHAAAEAANEQEAAKHFLPLIGLAAKFGPPRAQPYSRPKKLGGAALSIVGGKVIGRVGDQLLRRFDQRLMRRVEPAAHLVGVANVARTLFRDRATRQLIHTNASHARATTVARRGAGFPEVGASHPRWPSARFAPNRPLGPSVIRMSSRKPIAGPAH